MNALSSAQHDIVADNDCLICYFAIGEPRGDDSVEEALLMSCCQHNMGSLYLNKRKITSNLPHLCP
jgi:hypothetical protein